MAIPVARIEFLDAEQIKACNIYNEGKSEYLAERHEECPTLFLEFHGAAETEVQQQAITAGKKNYCYSSDKLKHFRRNLYCQ